MLRPEYLDHVGEELVVLFAQLQTRIEAEIARRIAKGKYGTAAAVWQKEKLEEVREFHKFLEKSLREAMRKAEPELKKSLKNAVKISIAADNRIIKEELGEAAVKAGALNQILNAGYAQTKRSLKNFCNSMGNVVAGELSKHLDLAYMEVKSGAFSAEQAIGHAVNSLAREGIHSIEYGDKVPKQSFRVKDPSSKATRGLASSGKKISIEAGVRRAVLSGINRTTCEASLQRAEELGTDLVKTTEHLGARPEHAVWQGRVFSLSGSSDKYPDFYEETGYGEAEGLGGANCRHSFYPFFEEFEGKEEYEGKIGDGKRNEKTYEAEQEQRYNERKIREWKRRAEVMEGGGQSNAREKEKVREWQGRQRELIKKHNLPREYGREKIY